MMKKLLFIGKMAVVSKSQWKNGCCLDNLYYIWKMI